MEPGGGRATHDAYTCYGAADLPLPGVSCSASLVLLALILTLHCIALPLPAAAAPSRLCTRRPTASSWRRRPRTSPRRTALRTERPLGQAQRSPTAGGSWQPVVACSTMLWMLQLLLGAQEGRRRHVGIALARRIRAGAGRRPPHPCCPPLPSLTRFD